MAQTLYDVTQNLWKKIRKLRFKTERESFIEQRQISKHSDKIGFYNNNRGKD